MTPQAAAPSPLLEPRTRQRLLIVVLVIWAIHTAKGFMLPVASPAMFWMLDVTYFVVMPIAALAIARGFTGLSPRDLLSRQVAGPGPGPQAAVPAALITIVGYFLCAGIVMWIMRSFPRAFEALPNKLSYAEIARGAGAWKRPVVVYFSITAALVEEYVYRGWLGRVMLEREQPRTWSYVAASALLFGTFHWHIGTFSVVTGIAMGAIAATMVVATRSIVGVIAGHFVIDVIAFG